MVARVVCHALWRRSGRRSILNVSVVLTAMPVPSVSYNSRLDGIRALAVAGVVASHLDIGLRGGFHGVTLFFVISGYLITSLLVSEFAKNGGVDFGAFYQRRFARLSPALYVVLAATVGWLLLIGAEPMSWWTGLVGALTYTSSILGPIRGGQGLNEYFNWSWSLSIEEIFYLLWPVLLVTGLRRGRIGRVIGVVLLLLLYIASWAWRAVLGASNASHARLYYSPEVHIDSLLLGVFLAFLLPVLARSPIARRSITVLGVVGLFGLFALFFVAAGGLPLTRSIDPGAFGQTAIVSGLLLSATVVRPGGIFVRWLGWRWLAFLGKLSYGVYLWNLLLVEVFIYLTGDNPGHSAIVAPYLLVLLIVSYVSWRYFETPLRVLLASKAVPFGWFDVFRRGS